MYKRQEVIYDDRSVSAGNKFSDADLLGVPVRVVVSPRNLKESVVEVSTREDVYKRQGMPYAGGQSGHSEICK